MKHIKRFALALLLAAVSLSANAVQTGKVMTQADLYDLFCDACGPVRATDIRNIVASVTLNASAAITGGTIDGVSRVRVPNGSSPEYGEITWSLNEFIYRGVQGGGTARNNAYDTATSGTLHLFKTGGTTRTQIQSTGLMTSGFLQAGSLTALTLPAGALGLSKITASGTAPGAAGGKFEVVCGTNAGSLKLIMYGGTSTTPSTVVDNVGGGATGC